MTEGNSQGSGRFLFTFLAGVALGMGILGIAQKFTVPSVARPTPTPDLLAQAAGAFYAKDYGRSEKIYEDVLIREPDNYEANKFLGTLWAQFLVPQDYRKSLYYIRKALEARKEYREMVFYADILLQSKDNAQCETALEDCLKMNEKDAYVWEDLGYVLRAQAKNPEALKAYEKAVKLDPGNENARKAVKDLRK